VIYLDNNATTYLPPEVREAMMPYFSEEYGNAASVHTFGSRLMNQMDSARESVGRLIGADPKDDLTFTSGGTESNNAILYSVVKKFPNRRHIITSTVEHSSVAKVAEDLEKQGYEITRVPVDREGRLDLNFFKNSIRSDTALVTLMWANNETGVLSPVAEISKITRQKGVLFHSDAVQAIGKVKINVSETPVDFLSVSAHKLHGPKGIGLLYVRKGVPFAPLILGGAQQNGRRAGTENMAGIVGFAVASDMAQKFVADVKKLEQEEKLCRKLEEGLLNRVSDITIAGQGAQRIPNTSQIIFEQTEGEALLQMMSDAGIYASGGSTCTAGTTQPSHVLLAMGFNEKQSGAAIRFSLSRYTTEDEINGVLEIMPKLVSKLRSI